MTDRATVGALWRSFQKQLEAAGLNPPPREGQSILAAALGAEVMDLIQYESAYVTETVLTEADRILTRRLAGEPLAHILGRAPFWSRDWAVHANVLIPRPDSETLVAEVLKDERKGLKVMEVGTGTGALLGSVLEERPTWHGTGIENAPAAHANSQENLAPFLSEDRVTLLDDLDAATGPFDIIFSNPPYVSEDEFAALEAQVKNHEPKSALTGDLPNPTGLTYYENWIPKLTALLAPGGTLALEVGHTQAAAVQALMLHAGLANISTINDMASRPRVVKGQGPAA